MSAPQWLSKHTSHSYIKSVCRALSEREAKRELARYVSRNPKTPDPSTPSTSLTSRLFRISSTPKSPAAPTSDYSVAVGYQPENQFRNRYLDVVPYDRTRVIVDLKRQLEGGEEEEGKYLNASWVLEMYGHKWWIATQAPLPNTAYTFLSLFSQPVTSPPKSLCPPSSVRPPASRIRTVVQLTKDVEGGRRKAHPYFPAAVGKSLVVPSDEDRTSALKVTLVSRQTIEEAHCIQSTISIVKVTPRPSNSDSNAEDEYRENKDDGNETTTFQHLLYTSWPDHGVPEVEHRASLLAFLRLVDSTNRDTSLPVSSHPADTDHDPDPPIIVGCSAGIGRTGSFIALSSLLRHFGFLPPANSPCLPSAFPPPPLGALPSTLQEDLVAQEVDSLREQRPGMVQRDEQILLIYEILSSAFEL